MVSEFIICLQRRQLPWNRKYDNDQRKYIW